MIDLFFGRCNYNDNNYFTETSKKTNYVQIQLISYGTGTTTITSTVPMQKYLYRTKKP